MTKTSLGSSLKLPKTLFWKRISKGTLISWTHEPHSTMTCSTVMTRTTNLQRTTTALSRTTSMPKTARLRSHLPWSLLCIPTTSKVVYKVNFQNRLVRTTCAILTSTLSSTRVCRVTRPKLNRSLGSRPPLSNSIYSRKSIRRCSSAPLSMTMSL
jgi:hypothetical protein